MTPKIFPFRRAKYVHCCEVKSDTSRPVHLSLDSAWVFIINLYIDWWCIYDKVVYLLQFLLSKNYHDQNIGLQCCKIECVKYLLHTFFSEIINFIIYLNINENMLYKWFINTYKHMLPGSVHTVYHSGHQIQTLEIHDGDCQQYCEALVS